ncbi:hypothetical protein CYY_006287 [Polysphondylium violaceum]|uniref:TalinB n=1 Tax=Polysphondylium violaceum TaxID=133409 RepID=A0A8J4PSW6_9MYCE|nr:hypothetical protein CYY_006287 [Polysphondylium violaceum]
MSIMLKINMVGMGTVKTLRFSPDMSIQEVCTHIFEKTNEGGADHGLYQPNIEGKQTAKWLAMGKTLAYYDINSDSPPLDYKKKHRPQKIKLLDETIKTQLVDESTSVSDIIAGIAKKMGIKNPEEYSFMNSKGDWLNNNQILSEQGVTEADIVVMKKKFFFNDANIDRNDPVQLHLLYVQCRDAIIEGKYPAQKEELLSLASLQCQVAMGDYSPAKHVSGYLNIKEYLPLQYVKTKNIEKDIYKEYKKLVNMSEVNAKYRYVQLCRSLKTYGMTSFEVKLRVPMKKKMVDHILGITREQMILIESETKEVIKSHPLKHIKRWAATEKSFTLDFGDHEEEYLILFTNKPDEISQLIGGYIEIIMKARRDTSKTITTNDESVGVEEVMAIKKGNVATSSTFMGYGGGNGGGHQLAPSQQIAITDLKSALRATDLLIGELNTFKGGNTATPQTFTRSFTTLTPQQFKHQLITHTNAIASAANMLFNDMSNPPAQGGIAAAQQSILKRAQIIMAELNTVGTSAKNAAYFPDLASFSDEIINCATKLSECMSKLLGTASTIQGDRVDEKGRLLAQNEIFNVNSLASMMIAVCDNMYVTESSSNLIIECAKNVSAALALMLSAGSEKINLIDDELLFSQIESTIKTTSLNNEEMLSTTETLASTSCHPESRKKITDITQAAVSNANSLLTAFKSGEIPEEDYAMLSSRVQDIMESVSLISYALDCAEQEQKISITSNGTEVGQGELLRGTNLSEEFSAVANDLTASLMTLRTNIKNPDDILESYRVIANNANRLISCTKAVASRADAQSQQRLFNSANAVFESVAVLSGHCRAYVKNPENESFQTSIMESAGHLQFLTQNMSADAGKIATIIALRDNSKDMISHVSSLMSVSRSSAQFLPDQSGISLTKASKDVTDALARLMIGIKKVVADPKSESTQMELLTSAQKQSLAPMNLVSTSKRVAPKITDPNQKQALMFASDAASQSVQRLMKSCEAYKKICGHIEIEEALEAFESTISDLETTEIAIQGGFLDTVPSQAREGCTELLMVSIKELNNAKEELLTEIKVNPGRLGELVKNTTSSAGQVALASKSLICATPGKQAQKKLAGITKQLMNDMEQLIRASRSVASNPDDPASELLLDAATVDVSTSVASLVGAASHIDCKELDEASTEITALIAVKLNSIDGIQVQPTEDLSYYSEELVSSTKALNAAILQVVAMARAKNLKGLGVSAKITSSTLTSLTNNAINAIALSENEATKQNILSSTAALGQQIIGVLDFAKARVANYKDPIYDQNLLQCSKSVEDHTNKVIRALGSTGSNQDCDEAIDRIIEVSRLLDQTFMPDVSGTQTNSALEMNHQQALLTMTESSKKLGSITSNLVSSKNNGEILGKNSMEAAESVAALVEAAKQVITCTISTSPPDILLPTKAILDSVPMIASNHNNLAEIIPYARTIATNTSALLNITRERTAGLREDDERQQLIKESVVKATQQLAYSTSNLAKAVKALTAQDPNSQSLISQALKDLQTSSTALLVSTSVPSIDRGISSADFEKLLATTRNVCTSSTNLITSASSSSSKPKDQELQSILSESAVEMTSAIKDILKVSSSMMPGVNFCEEAIEVAQRSIGDLSSMALSVAVGSFDVPSNNKENLSMVESQERLAEITKSIGAGINDLLKASRQSPEAIGVSAKSLSFIAPSLVSATKVALCTLSEQDAQNDLVTESKNLGNSILKLCNASLQASSNPSKETYQAIVTKCSEASEVMSKLVAQISSGVNLIKDLEECIEKIKKSIISTNAKENQDSKSYQEYKEDITADTKHLAIALKSIVSTDQSNLVQISTMSKDVANYISNVAQNVSSILFTTSDQKIRDSIVINARQVIQNTAEMVALLKSGAMDKNSSNQTQINDAFRSTHDGITRFLQSLKQGAIGEILSDAAVENIRKVITDLDAYSLFAAAGQLDEDSLSSSKLDQATQQANLKNLQKDIVYGSKLLIVSASQLVGSSKGTQEHLGSATTKVANTVTDLVKSAKEIASVLSDIGSQQDILSASKALSIASQQLVLAGKDAQRFKKDTTAFRSLGKAAEGVAEVVGNFLASVYHAISEAGRGIKELEKTFVLVTSYHEKPENIISNSKASAETFAQAARDVAKSSIDIVTSYQTSQDELVKSSQELSASVQSFISNSKGVLSLLGTTAEEEELKTKVNENVKNVTLTVLNHIKQVKDQDKGVTGVKVSASSRAVADNIQSILAISKSLPGGQNIVVDDDITEDLEQTAEDELLACAKSIEEATANLIAARPKTKITKGGMLDAEGIAATIVDASSAIAQAVSRLVHAAAVAQGKRRENAVGNFYSKDPTWSNGLISAAKAVAAATHRLVEAGIKAGTGKAEEEELIATARAVAAATALLVSASRAKSGDDSGSQAAHSALSAAAKKVAAATSDLVSAAKAATVFEEQQEEEQQQDFNFTGSKVKELEQQMKILRLEKELESERRKMLNSRKQNYKK